SRWCCPLLPRTGMMGMEMSVTMTMMTGLTPIPNLAPAVILRRKRNNTHAQPQVKSSSPSSKGNLIRSGISATWRAMRACVSLLASGFPGLVILVTRMRVRLARSRSGMVVLGGVGGGEKIGRRGCMFLRRGGLRELGERVLLAGRKVRKGVRGEVGRIAMMIVI
ncbi:hypothetical protein RJ035_007817, partial [Blastomyces gilchristii]